MVWGIDRCSSGFVCRDRKFTGTGICGGNIHDCCPVSFEGSHRAAYLPQAQVQLIADGFVCYRSGTSLWVYWRNPGAPSCSGCSNPVSGTISISNIYVFTGDSTKSREYKNTPPKIEEAYTKSHQSQKQAPDQQGLLPGAKNCRLSSGILTLHPAF